MARYGKSASPVYDVQRHTFLRSLDDDGDEDVGVKLKDAGTQDGDGLQQQQQQEVADDDLNLLLLDGEKDEEEPTRADLEVVVDPEEGDDDAAGDSTTLQVSIKTLFCLCNVRVRIPVPSNKKQFPRQFPLSSA